MLHTNMISQPKEDISAFSSKLVTDGEVSFPFFKSKPKSPLNAENENS